MHPPAASPGGARPGILALVAPLAILILLGFFLARPAGPGPDPRAAAAAAGEPAVVDPPQLALAPTSSAWSVDPASGPRAEELRDAVIAARRRLAEAPASPSPVPSRPVPAELAHRGAPLTAAQHSALGRLRWNSPGKQVEWRSAAQKPVLTYLEGRRLEPGAAAADPGRSLAATTARRFLRKHAAAFGAGDADEAWRLQDESRDELGYTQLRYTQHWQGLEVWPGGMTVQTAANGDITLVTAAYAPEPAIDLRPGVSGRVARVAAVQGLGLRAESATGPAELLVHAPLESAARLAWRVMVDGPPLLRQEVFVDARDGSVIERLPRVVSAAASGTGTDLDGQTRTIELWQHSDNLFYTIDTSKGMYDPTSQPPDVTRSRGIIAVLNLQNSTQNNIGDAVHNTASSANGPWDADAVSASVNLSRVYDYYLERFGRNSVDGNGGSMTGIVDLNDNNAYSDPQTQTMSFGNQDRWAESLDFVAHEMTHSVISTTSKLVYRFQSGALNESFADVLGEGCEAHFNGGVPDWQLGTQLSTPLRSLDDPDSLLSFLSAPYPEKMSEFNNIGIGTDRGGVHVNSSIPNHAFYQLAEGLPGAIGIDDTLQIFFRAVTTKLNPNSQFIDARLACVQSAEELFGNGSAQAQKTAEAFDFVEIFDQQPTPDPVPTPSVDAQDSTLFIFPSGGTTWLGRRETAFGDASAGVFLGDMGVGTPVLAGKKPAVRGDGAFAVYVTPAADGAFINTETGVEAMFGLAGQIESAAISANGNLQAYVLRDGFGNPDNRIYVFDESTGGTETYTITQPLTDQTGSATAATVLFVDALDVSPDGRFIFYDALNRLTYPGGSFIDTWSISFIDREAGTIQNFIPPIAGVNVGNPSIGQTRNDLMTFDVVDGFGVNYIYVANLTSGVIRPLSVLAGGVPVAPGWPGYSGDDAAVVYTDYQFNPGTGFFEPFLESQPVLADGVSANGGAFAWLGGSSPQLGLIYRRGSWSGPPELTVEASDASAAEPAGDPGSFLVSRAGPTTKAAAFSFVLTGSATNGSDYGPVALSGTIPAGQPSLSVPIGVIDDADPEGPETVVLTLAEGLGYTLGDGVAATVTIDDDEALSFATWAAGFGIGPTDFEGNTDSDPFPHLIEYALGTDPGVATPSEVIRLVIEDGHAVLEVSRSQKPSDVAVVVEVAPGPAGPWQSGPPHTTVLSDTTTSLRVRDNAALATHPEHYLRLVVTKL